jgi:hypothetical protein
MRERHFPRVCRSCRAPMARQEDTCWRCGVLWASGAAARTTLRVIAGGASTRVAAAAKPRVAVADNARAAADARLDADRWINDGGSVAAEAAAPLDAVTGRR